MGTTLNTRQLGDVTVIDVTGRITLAEGSSAIRDQMRTLISQGNRKVLLNLGGVIYVDSSGLGELVSGYTTMANAGGSLKLLNPNKRIIDLLMITNLHTLIDVHQDEAQAVGSFA